MVLKDKNMTKVIGITGGSGTGKTTLAKLILLKMINKIYFIKKKYNNQFLFLCNEKCRAI